MNIAVVTPTMKSCEKGGAEALFQELVRNLRKTVHNVDQIEVIIDESNFDTILASYLACYDLDLRGYDLVISTKAPTYMVRHHNHVSYLLHTIRVFYDMFKPEYGTGTSIQKQQRQLIHTLDKHGLHPDRVQKHFAVGSEAFKRLYRVDSFWRQIKFHTLHPPPVLTGFQQPRQGEYVFLPGRLHRWKRVDLIIRAFKQIQRDITLKIAGTGEDEHYFRSLAYDDKRIEFLGRVSEQQLIELYSRALVVPFVPLQEDYGLITIEAFSSKKPVITCYDSGEPTHFVKDGENGFIVKPSPKAIAHKIQYLIDHPEEAAEMGRKGSSAIAQLNWDFVISQLTSTIGSENQIHKRFTNPAKTDNQSSSQTYQVTVLDMQPIEPAVGGGRLRLLGLYHGLGKRLPTTYIGTYDWPGEKYRHHRHSDTLTEITVPLSNEHFLANDELRQQAGGKNIIDVSFDLLAHLSPQFIAAASTQTAQADIVIFSHPWIYPLVKDQLRKNSQLIIYDSHNVEGLLRAMLLDDGATGTELVKHVACLEYELCQAADLVLACSHEDRELFHKLYNIPYSKILIVPNGTFINRFSFIEESRRNQIKQKLGIDDKPLALFIGSPFQPNVEAAIFICTTLAPMLPEITFVIAGGVVDRLNHLKTALTANIRLTGRLTEEEKLDYFAAADLAINPMFSGSGTNIKMFDFMAARLPIISTPIGARGILSGPEKAFHVCEAVDFVMAIKQVVEDRLYARKLAIAADRLVAEVYSWERISAKLGLLLERLRAKINQPAPFFSIIVPTYQRHHLLEELIAHLRAQTFKDFEVIIVDQSHNCWNGYTQYPDLDIFYIHTDVKGAVNARNTAAFYARGKVLAFTDDDCQPRPDWLEKAVDYFDNPQVVGIEGQVFSDNVKDTNYRIVSNVGFEGMGFMTANLFLQREVFMTIDGFDSLFDHPHFREDTDLAWRALNYGEIPYGHDVRVYHPPQPYQQKEGWIYGNHFEKDVLLLKKHPERYRTLFLKECHYLTNARFRKNFLSGAQKYGVDIDEFYLWQLNRVDQND
ncbi:MAG: glycosyltransferase [Acidobacteriota bacterium]